MAEEQPRRLTAGSPLVVTVILGDADEPRFAGRRSERIAVTSGDAAKRRLRAVTDGGTDVAVDLPRGSYLRHGAVLADDGECLVVVERAPEEAMVIRFDLGGEAAELIVCAARVGHAFGNQHVPVEVENGEIRVPVTTSRDVAEQAVRVLGLPSVEIEFRRVRLGCSQPLAASHTH
jgi:urease accessory protein